MKRKLVKTIHNTNAPLWIITLSANNIQTEFAVYSPDLDTAIYEVLTDQDSKKSAIVSITRN